MDYGTPRERYVDLRAHHQEGLDSSKARSFRLGTLRAITFVGLSAGLVAFDVLAGTGETVALVASAVLFVVFIWQVVFHRSVRREQRWHGVLLGLVNEGVLRSDRAWGDLDEAIPARERPVAVDVSGHPFSRDLAVLGPASLFRLLGPVTGEPGRVTASEWLLAPASPEVALMRAEAVRELSGAFDTRLTFAAHGRLAPDADPTAVSKFQEWAAGEAWMLEERRLRLAAWILPTLLIGAAAADIFMGAPPFWLLPGLVQLGVVRRVTKRLTDDFAAVEYMAPALAAYVPQFHEVSSWQVQAPALRDVVARMESDGRSAHERLAGLGRLVDTVASRRNMVYASLAPFLLLDVHLAVRLDRWRSAHGPNAAGWIGALGEMEALCGLGSLAHDHPEWTFPEWDEDGSARVEASALGHPLFAPGDCVRNDVTVGPPGSFTLVTGSNMSGKSTLLRSIGTNAVLAGAGAPVCAASMSLPRVRVRTSMSIEDSLSSGVSLFMAQLIRVRDIVLESESGDSEEGPVLFLLDEMLHGTNSAERRIAAQAVLRHLLEHEAIGAVSTHDLGLADSEDLRAAADAVHFRETVHRDQGTTRLEFDYLMRPGLAQTSNALVLLEAVGLDPKRAKDDSTSP